MVTGQKTAELPMHWNKKWGLKWMDPNLAGLLSSHITHTEPGNNKEFSSCPQLPSLKIIVIKIIVIIVYQDYNLNKEHFSKPSPNTLFH